MLTFGVSATFYAFSTNQIYFSIEDFSELILHLYEVKQIVAGGFVEVNEDVDVAGFGIEVGAEN